MRGAGIIFVLFDDCWNDHYTPGVQPDPIPGIHNSRWLQCPGNNPVTEEQMKNYVIDVIAANRNRETVVMWDLYNEVGNSGKLLASLPLAKKVFEWSRSANPTQPLTSGHWNNDIAFDLINEFILSESDIITFHAYCDVTCTHNAIT